VSDTRLIDANALEKEIISLEPFVLNDDEKCDVLRQIRHQPTLGYAPVKCGKWEKDKDDLFWGNSFIHMRCSLCGGEAHLNRFGMAYILSQFCPNCGARMSGNEANNESNS